MERCAGERGKGFFWSVDEKFEHTLEAKVKAADAAASAPSGSTSIPAPNTNAKSTSKKRDKGASLLEPPLKRSVRDVKGGPLPPPLTSTPLVMKSSSAPAPSATSYTHSSSSYNNLPPTSEQTSPSPTATPSGSWPPHPSTTPITQTSSAAGPNHPTSIIALPPDLRVPLVVGPAPPLPSSSATNTSTPDSDPIVLRAGVLYLDPSVFSHLTQEQLKELESLGAMKAIEILKGYIVNYFKAKKKVEAGKARGRGRGRGKKGGMGRGGGAVSSSVGGPFTNTPLPARGIHHTPGLQDKDQYTVMNGSAPLEVDSKPPVPVPVNSVPPMSSLTQSPIMASLPPPPLAAPIPNGNGTAGRRDVASPILVVDDIDDDAEREERPVAKRRRLDVLDVGMDIEVM
jgi:forkhead box protein K